MKRHPSTTTKDGRMALHRDNDEERRARVQAMLERLHVAKKRTPKAAIRLKSRTDTRRKSKRG